MRPVPPDVFRAANPLALFPTMVMAFELTHAEAVNQRILKFLRRHRRQFPLWQGKERPWQCHPNLHEEPAFEPLVRAVVEGARAMADVTDTVVEDVRINGMWANWLLPGDHHPPHRHANSWISGAYWVRTDEPSTIVFHHPLPPAIQPTLRQHTHANSTVWNIQAVPGQLVMFPSQLLHHVPTVSGERVSVSFNLLPTGQLLDPDTLQAARFV